MSSTCFDPEASPSGRRLYIQVCYSVFHMYRYTRIEYTLLPTELLILMHVKHCLSYLYLQPFPEDEPSGSKHVKDFKNKK
jgi:hypothetical protein